MKRKGRGPGRISSTVKENMVRVFEDIGGHQKMAAWASKNPDNFYRLYCALAPKELVADINADVNIHLVSYLEDNSNTESDA